jgi:hypothetical protein
MKPCVDETDADESALTSGILRKFEVSSEYRKILVSPQMIVRRGTTSEILSRMERV